MDPMRPRKRQIREPMEVDEMPALQRARETPPNEWEQDAPPALEMEEYASPLDLSQNSYNRIDNRMRPEAEPIPARNSGGIRDDPKTTSFFKKTSEGSTAMNPTPLPKKVTQVRKEVLATFFEEDFYQPNRFGEFGGDEWIQQLIQRLKLRHSTTGNVTAFDVNSWLQKRQVIALRESIIEALSSSRTDHPLASGGRPSAAATSTITAPVEERIENMAECTGSQEEEMDAYEENNTEENSSLSLQAALNGSYYEEMDEHVAETNTVGVEDAAVPGTNSSSFAGVIAVPYLNGPGEQSSEDVALPGRPQPSFEQQEENMKKVKIESNGFLFHLPACELPAQLIIQPAAWYVLYDIGANSEMEADQALGTLQDEADVPAEEELNDMSWNSPPVGEQSMEREEAEDCEP